ncbi:PadR family transcriptional regulator [Bacteroidota bacterium]
MKQHLGEFEEIVLLITAAQQDEAYGMSITKTIEEELNRSVTLSSVHTALYRLEEKGFVKSHIGGASDIRGGRSKRFFTVTNSGIDALKKSKQMRMKLWDMASGLVGERS